MLTSVLKRAAGRCKAADGHLCIPFEQRTEPGMLFKADLCDDSEEFCHRLNNKTAGILNMYFKAFVMISWGKRTTVQP